MSIHITGAKARAKLLSQRLKALGVSLQHTQALEALAASEGFQDWNRYQAHLEHAPQTHQEDGARAALALIIGRPGTGKSTGALKHGLARRSLGPTLWVSAGECEDLHGLTSEPGDRNITLVYGPNGEISPLPVLDGQGATALFFTPGAEVAPCTPKGDAAMKQAFETLLAHIEQAVIGGAWKPTTMVFDETHRVHRPGQTRAFCHRLTDWGKTVPAHCLIITQAIQSLSADANAPWPRTHVFFTEDGSIVWGEAVTEGPFNDLEQTFTPQNTLRRKPSIIQIDDANDVETIGEALNALTTGHFLYSSVHPNK